MVSWIKMTNQFSKIVSLREKYASASSEPECKKAFDSYIKEVDKALKENQEKIIFTIKSI
jgi:ribosome recycling factor